MKIFKMVFLTFFVCVMVSNFTSIRAMAENQLPVLEKKIHISIDGRSAQLQNVLFFNNRIYVPIGITAESLDCTVDWNSEHQQLFITKKTVVQDFDEANPQEGERFVYGEIISKDLKDRLLTIEEHYDDQYIHTEPHLFVLPDAVIILQRNNKGMNLDFEDLKIGDVVGLVLNKEGNIRGIILND